MGHAGSDFEASLKSDDMGATHEIFGGEASTKEIDRIADKADGDDTDVIIGLGGDKTIDTAHSVADRARLPVAIFPIAVSADALVTSVEAQAVNRANSKRMDERSHSTMAGLGFEDGGLAAVHAIHNGFTAFDGDIHHMSRGEKIAFGIGVHLMLEGTPKEEANKYIGFMQSVGLPITLE